MMPLSTQNEDADDLTANNVPDLLANEQTWPTEEEMMSAPAVSAAPGEAMDRKVKRVPKGTSAYQAAWIFDDLDEEDAEEDAGEDAEAHSASDVMDDESQRECTVMIPGLLMVLTAVESDDEEEESEEIELDSRAPDHKDLAPEDEELQLVCRIIPTY